MKKALPALAVVGVFVAGVLGVGVLGVSTKCCDQCWALYTHRELTLVPQGDGTTDVLDQRWCEEHWQQRPKLTVVTAAPQEPPPEPVRRFEPFPEHLVIDHEALARKSQEDYETWLQEFRARYTDEQWERIEPQLREQLELKRELDARRLKQLHQLKQRRQREERERREPLRLL